MFILCHCVLHIITAHHFELYRDSAKNSPLVSEKISELEPLRIPGDGLNTPCSLRWLGTLKARVEYYSLEMKCPPFLLFSPWTAHGICGFPLHHYTATSKCVLGGSQNVEMLSIRMAHHQWIQLLLAFHLEPSPWPLHGRNQSVQGFQPNLSVSLLQGDC